VERHAAIGEIRELASGIDALYLSGRAAVPSGLLDRLAEARVAAEMVSEAVPIELGGSEFAMAPFGWGKYRYRLLHDNGLVGVTRSERLPALRIQPRAEFLHGVGPDAAVDWFRQRFEDEVGPLRLSVSRVDLHADWQGWVPDWDDRERFVCRANALAMRGDCGDLTGWEFGRKGTKTISARIYDKTLEVEQKGNDYWLDIWGDAYEPELPVLRVEFEFGREGLREFRIDLPGEAIDASGALWVSATHEWLSYRSPTDDQTRSRWPVAPEWEQVQRARLADGAAGLDRIREGRRLGTLRTLGPSLVGYLAAFGANVGTVGIGDTCEALPRFLEHYSRWSGISFEDRIASKRQAE